MADNDTKNLDLDFHEFRAMMAETAKNLKRMRETMEKERWQFGGIGLKEFEEFAEEVDAAVDGWMSSVC